MARLCRSFSSMCALLENWTGRAPGQGTDILRSETKIPGREAQNAPNMYRALLPRSAQTRNSLFIDMLGSCCWLKPIQGTSPVLSFYATFWSLLKLDTCVTYCIWLEMFPVSFRIDPVFFSRENVNLVCLSNLTPFAIIVYSLSETWMEVQSESYALIQQLYSSCAPRACRGKLLT